MGACAVAPSPPVRGGELLQPRRSKEGCQERNNVIIENRGRMVGSHMEDIVRPRVEQNKRREKWKRAGGRWRGEMMLNVLDTRSVDFDGIGVKVPFEKVC